MRAGDLLPLSDQEAGSTEEIEDIKRAYIETDNTIGEIMGHIPHSTFEDEPRFIKLITQLCVDSIVFISNSNYKSSKHNF